MSTVACDRCKFVSRADALFCARCGLCLLAGVDGSRRPGAVRHPRPTDVPLGSVPVRGAANLFWRSESSLGGGAPIIGIEGLLLTVANSGYALSDVKLRATGESDAGKTLFTVNTEIAELPAGGETTFEIPSYEIPAPCARLTVELLAARYATIEPTA